MGNVKAILLSNTVAATTEFAPTAEEFMEAQNEMNEPMVLIVNTKTNECLKQFRISAKNMDELMEMFELKYFETPDIPEGQWRKCCEGYFIGVGPEEKIKERTAGTVRSS